MKKAVTLANCVLAGMTALCLPAALTVHANCLFLDPVPCSKQAGHPNMEGIFLVPLYRSCLSAAIPPAGEGSRKTKRWTEAARGRDTSSDAGGF